MSKVVLTFLQLRESHSNTGLNMLKSTAQSLTVGKLAEVRSRLMRIHKSIQALGTSITEQHICKSI